MPDWCMHHAQLTCSSSQRHSNQSSHPPALYCSTAAGLLSLHSRTINSLPLLSFLRLYTFGHFLTGSSSQCALPQSVIPCCPYCSTSAPFSVLLPTTLRYKPLLSQAEHIAVLVFQMPP